MEMNLKPKRIPPGLSNRGFTMVELLVALVVSLLALGAIYSTFMNQQKSYHIQDETAAMHQNIRAAMFYMEREIRMAGCDPLGSADAKVLEANANSIRFTEDIVGDNPGDDPDGNIDDPNEDIKYSLSGGNLVRENVLLGGGAQMVAQNIDAIDFVYLDGASPPNVLNDYGAGGGSVPAADRDRIRSVEVTIVARTERPLLASQNSRAYENQRGRQIFVSPDDHVSRRRLTAVIHCRNLGL
ncbi:MAG: prepilin-type N-terminal cleavage/methylation domain-containing protein [Desulfobacterales bacterium]